MDAFNPGNENRPRWIGCRFSESPGSGIRQGCWFLPANIFHSFWLEMPNASFCFHDWTGFSDAGGPLCNCFHNNCEPCCGEPCNVLDGLYCFTCMACCFPCVQVKWWASQVDQPCALLNHVLPFVILQILGLNTFVFCWLNRYNTRMIAGVYEEPSDGFDKCIGDCFLGWCPCTGCCAFFQQLRAEPKTEWDCLDCSAHGSPVCCAPSFKLISDRKSPAAKTMK